MTITLQPQVLQWARERAGLSVEELALKFSKKDAARWEEKITTWEQEGELTYKQAEDLAQKTQTSFGYLFLDKPPLEKLPIPDFRTVGSAAMEGEVSPNLLEVIYQSQRKQDWYRDHQQEQGEEPLEFIGSTPVKNTLSAVREAAKAIRDLLGYYPGQSNKNELNAVLREFSDAAEAIGILVVRAGKVGNNTSRLLNPSEFRGFALVDPWAPLVFVNTADAKAAQIFTLAHELAHLWAGESALSNLSRTYAPEQQLEQFCNAVAAEYLIPLQELTRLVGSATINESLVSKLRLRFKVSDLVVIRRLHDAKKITQAKFKKLYEGKLEEYALMGGKSGGGNFHNTQPSQIGRRFGSAIITSTLEGNTLYRDALSLLNLKKESSLKQLAANLDLAF
jgi:Zn-dependent peptidase ImmA (M78 family)